MPSLNKYSRIQVWHNGAWTPIKRMRVRQSGDWSDLGAADGDGDRLIEVYDNQGRRHRVNLNKRIISHPGTSYNNGGFEVYPGNYCFCPNGDYATSEFIFEANIRRESSGAKNILSMRTRTASYTNSYLVLTLNDNNTLTLTVSSDFAGNTPTRTYTTSATINNNAWNNIRIYCPYGKKSYKVYITINGVTETMPSVWQTFLIYTRTIAGAPGLHIRSDGFYLKSCDGNRNVIASSQVNTNENDSYTEEVWE